MFGIRDKLSKTILYTLNAANNDKLAAMAGCFQDAAAAGKIQFGSAWWFNDHYDGMTTQLKSLANIGVLSRFVGMLTDSRSFLSYPHPVRGRGRLDRQGHGAGGF